MPRQKKALTSAVAGRKVEIIKTYDQKYAHEVFSLMNDAALDHLAISMKLSADFEESDTPPRSDEEYTDFLWGEMLDAAREDWNLFSFFVVKESDSANARELFVSPDWPTAEAYLNLLSNGVLTGSAV